MADVYNVRLSAAKGTDTDIQAYDDDLAFVSEWEVSSSAQAVSNFASDDDGNVYLGWIGSNYLLKFTNEGVADGYAYIYEVRDVVVDSSGYIDALTKYTTTQYRVFQRNSDLTTRSYLNLDSGTYYSGLAFEDSDIFYTNNIGTTKMEKWSLTDGEKKLVSTNNLASGVSSMGLIGDVLGGTYTTTCFTMNKSLTGAITTHTIDECAVTGEIYAKYFAFLGVVEDNFILVFKAVTEHYLDYGAWFIRKYNSSFTQVGATVVLAICTSATSHYYRVASKRAVAVVPEITTQDASEIGYWATMGNGTIVAGEPTERGFEIVLSFAGTLNNAIEHSIAGFAGDVTWDIVNKWNGTLTKTESETGTYTTGAYELVLGYPSVLGNPSSVFNDKLFKCEDYTYRAYMIIGDTTYRGEYVAFSTLCDAGEEQQVADDISDGNPIVPIIPIEDEPEYPPFEYEYPPLEPYPPWNWDLPPWEMPDYPPWSWVGDFYYRKPYTKKDLDDLRRKCIIYNKNSVEFALVLRHNMNVLKEFFNMMTDYMDKEEFNDFTDLIPPQRLKELYLDPLEVNDFRDMINGFIRNTVDNNIAVNRNFKLIQDGLSDYETESDDAYFREINSNMKSVTEDNPDVHRLKRVIDNLNQEVSFNFSEIMRNLKIIRARLL